MKYSKIAAFDKLMSTLNTKTIFLIDGLGAIMTALFLTVILLIFEKQFEIPADILITLSIIALTFSVYSFTCFLFYDKISSRFLLPIIIANATYCFLTLGLVAYNFNRLNFLGIAYFIIEILLLCGLIYVEYKIFKKEDTSISR